MSSDIKKKLEEEIQTLEKELRDEQERRATQLTAKEWSDF